MGLIYCRKCGKKVSDKAENCIHCKAPINKKISEPIKKKTNAGSVVLWVLLSIFIGLPVLIIIIALFVGMSSVNTHDNNITSSDFNKNDFVNNSNIVENKYSANMIIDKVPITLANLYPVRVTIINTGTKTIYPRFDIIIKDDLNNSVCDGSSFTDDFGSIYSGDSKTGEITFLGCMFNKDGNYKITITLIDSSYNKITESSKDITVNYWGLFGIDQSNSNTLKVYDANLEIKKVTSNFGTLDPIRITINNIKDSFTPELDFTVKKRNEIVCEGKVNSFEVSKLNSNSEKTFEVNIFGCILDKDGSYDLIIDLLDPEYNILSTDSYNFKVDYWDQFN